jgi:hypothetical protein
MAAELRAIEVTGSVDEEGRLTLDEPLHSVRPGHVRLIILAPGRPNEGTEPLDQEEQEWLEAAAANPAFSFLHDPAEDIYSPEDGRPFHDKG